MKKILLTLCLLTAIILAAAAAVFASPYYFYNEVITGKHRSHWYHISDFNPLYITPKGVELETPNLGNEDLWTNFHFKDTVVPLPVRNPFYYVAPVVNYDKESDKTKLGLAVYGTGYREISKLFFVSNMMMGAETRSQELFKLPLVRNIIKNKSSEQVWHDLFTKSLSDWNIPFSEMAYNLYLLQLRNKLLPKDIISFGALDKNTGVARLASRNKDYITELVMTRSRGIVYSYLILTEKDNNDSKVLRYKFLRDIKFRPGSKSLSKIVYKEFKALPYKRKVDHEGMLYLLSSWSHQIDNKELLKEMILWLERGDENQKQLRPLYTYASQKYGEVFAKKLVDGLELDPEIMLKRNIELERSREIKELKEAKVEIAPKPLSAKELYQERIKRAKKSKSSKSDRMIMD